MGTVNIHSSQWLIQTRMECGLHINDPNKDGIEWNQQSMQWDESVPMNKLPMKVEPQKAHMLDCRCEMICECMAN